MEDWQSQHITKNLPELSYLTRFNVIVKAVLLEQCILSKADVDALDALQTRHGQEYATYEYYQLLLRRVDAYKVLTKALIESRQSGAAKILIDGVPNYVSDKSLTYLGIPINLDGFKDMEIEVNGKKIIVHDFFPTANYEILQEIFQHEVSELEIYDAFVMKQRTFVLANNTLPHKPPYYVPRFLSNRIKIDDAIFRAECPDVFVFKKNITKYKLSKVAKPHITDTSTSQLHNITSRFIYLNDDEDWTELKKIANVPIHLINYEHNGNHFILEDSSAPSDILMKLGSREQRAYMSEEEFVQQQLSEDYSSSSVCICDTPGMGKTFLLANIARLMAANCVGRIVVFIQLTSFAQDYFPGFPNTIPEPVTSLINVLSYVCPTPRTPTLLLTLVKAEILRLELFFDGFDEIPTEKVEWTKQVFRCITTKFPKVKIYITSRPHMRHLLETSLGVMAYDILPFNQQNQVDFLVQFWQNRTLDSDYVSLQNYAITCLKAINESLTKTEKEIAGIPLLCQLIAEVYSHRVAFHSMKRRKFSDFPLQISGMYQQFIENKIKLVSINKDEFDKIKLVHIWHALKLLFPTNDLHDDNMFENVKDLLTSDKILMVGILQLHSNGALECIHRTFAENLVADYFFLTLQGTRTNYNTITILSLLLKCQKSKQEYEFVHPVIVSFFNSALVVKDEISDQLRIQTAAFTASISHDELICMLCACCQHNLVNIFCLLTQTLTKWDNCRILDCFTDENSYELFYVCVTKSSSQMFHACIQLLAEEHKLDLEQINTYKDNTLMQAAVQSANYEAVEYFVDRISLKNPQILEKCIEHSHNNADLMKRENIVHLLLHKIPTLIHENPNILACNKIDPRLLKLLVKFGANLTSVNEYGQNCAMIAAEYMSSSEFHELVQFLLTDCKAEYLFVSNKKWKDPLPKIIKWATIFPETLEVLLNIPSIDINMKDSFGDNLLFAAVRGDKVGNLQKLVDRGLDYNERGMKNRSLLHAAARYGELEMVRYLLSLKLDPNCRDKREWTPLHNAVYYRRGLSVIEILVENGANIHAKNKWGQTALHLSSTHSSYTSSEIIKYLVRNGLGVNHHDNDGNTPLHLCADKKVLLLLVEMGADIHAKNKNGETSAQVNPRLWKSYNFYSNTEFEMDED